MPKPAHYTVRSDAESPEPAPQNADHGERLRAELGNHYAQTCTLHLERRIGTRWKAILEVDVLHPDEPGGESELDDETKVAELVALIERRAEDEAAVEGPSRFKCYGRAERSKRELFCVPWVLGGAMLPSESTIEAKDANASALTAMARALDVMGRHLDRAHDRSQRAYESALGGVTKTIEQLNAVIDMGSKVSRPEVELRAIEMAEKKIEADARIEVAHSEQWAAMFGEAIEVVGRSIEARAAASARSNGGTDDASNRTPPPGFATPRACREARDLAGVLEPCTPVELDKVKALLSEDEWSVWQAAIAAESTEAFDAAFGRLVGSWLSRGTDAARKLSFDMAEVIGPFRGMTIKRLLDGYQARHPPG